MQIIKKADDENIRSIAVQKITDQAFLAKLAEEDKDDNVRLAAVKTLTDQGLLAKIAIDAKNLARILTK